MKKSLLGIILLYICIYILPLVVRPVIVPDEPRYGEIPREMIASGDWVVPRLNGVRYFEKPVMGYWLNAISIKLFGANAFAIRFPSAVSAGFSGVLVYILSSMMAGGRVTGLFSAAIYLSFLGVLGAGVFSVLDSMFSLFVTATMSAFYLFHTALERRNKAVFLFLFGVFAGCAFLVKGFVAFVIPIAAIVPFLFWEKRAKDLFSMPWIPILVAVLTILPWGIMIHLRAPDFWNFFIFNEHIRRFMADDAQHAKPIWFYIPVLAVGILPWSFSLPAAISGLKKEGFKDITVRYAVCWFFFSFLFFSVTKGKLPTYIIPALPALAILIAVGLQSYIKQDGTYLKKGALGMFFFASLLVLALPVIQTFGTDRIKPYVHVSKWILLESGLIVWALLSLQSAKAKEKWKQITLFGAAPLFLVLMLQCALPDTTLASKAPGDLLKRNAHKISPKTMLIATGSLAPSACWFYRRDDVYCLDSVGELEYGFTYPDSQHRLFDIAAFKNLLAESTEKGNIVLFTKKRDYEKWKNEFPAPMFEDQDGKYILLQY